MQLDNFTFLHPHNIIHSENVKISVWPNPCTDYLAISSDESIQEIQVSDASGRVFRVNKNPGENPEIMLSTGDLSPGLYFLTIRLADGIVSREFIKID